MRVAVTGGAGFIGANLCRSLDRRPEFTEVVVLDDLSTGLIANLSGLKLVRLVVCDVADGPAVEKAIEGVDAIVHLAARPSVPRSLADPVASHRANVDGTIQVLEAARRCGIPYLIVASSSSVYGKSLALPKSEIQKPSPISPYAATKLASEVYALAWQQSFGINVLALRLFNVFGPFQAANHSYAAVVPCFMSAAIRRQPLPIDGDGRQTRDFTYVATVVDVIVEALTGRVHYPEPVNLAIGVRTTLLELVATIERAVGHSLERCHRQPRPGDIRHSQADGSRLRELFPGIAAMPLDEAIQHTAAWYKAQETSAT